MVNLRTRSMLLHFMEPPSMTPQDLNNFLFCEIVNPFYKGLQLHLGSKKNMTFVTFHARKQGDFVSFSLYLFFNLFLLVYEILPHVRFPDFQSPVWNIFPRQNGPRMSGPLGDLLIHSLVEVALFWNASLALNFTLAVY